MIQFYFQKTLLTDWIPATEITRNSDHVYFETKCALHLFTE